MTDPRPEPTIWRVSSEGDYVYKGTQYPSGFFSDDTEFFHVGKGYEQRVCDALNQAESLTRDRSASVLQQPTECASHCGCNACLHPLRDAEMKEQEGDTRMDTKGNPTDNLTAPTVPDSGAGASVLWICNTVAAIRDRALRGQDEKFRLCFDFAAGCAALEEALPSAPLPENITVPTNVPVSLNDCSCDCVNCVTGNHTDCYYRPSVCPAIPEHEQQQEQITALPPHEQTAQEKAR